MQIAYADTFSGISGDMFLGALVDAGLPDHVLKEELAALDLAGFDIITTRVKVKGIAATKIKVVCPPDHPHRSWKTIRHLLDRSNLPPDIRETSVKIFAGLARAEAAVHGCQADEVHFHEVGAVDSIIDIVGAAIGLHYFGIERLVSSPLPMSRGWVECAHGRLPLPAPAVMELVREMPVYGVAEEEELVTPTGAAIVKTLAHSIGPFPAMTVKRVGYGAGERERADAGPNLLRLVIGTGMEVSEAQEVEVIETHLDDWQPEGYPHLSELLFRQGALDVVIMPIQMKKGRPGFLLRVVATAATAWELKRTILSETTAIGLRYRTEGRWTLPRQKGTLMTCWGKVLVKRVETPAGPVFSPEYEDCRRLADTKKIPLQRVYVEVGKANPDSFEPVA